MAVLVFLCINYKYFRRFGRFEYIPSSGILYVNNTMQNDQKSKIHSALPAFVKKIYIPYTQTKLSHLVFVFKTSETLKIFLINK